jgi:hypothetical protein
MLTILDAARASHRLVELRRDKRKGNASASHFSLWPIAAPSARRRGGAKMQKRLQINASLRSSDIFGRVVEHQGRFRKNFHTRAGAKSPRML